MRLILFEIGDVEVKYLDASTGIRIDRIVDIGWNRTRRHGRCPHTLIPVLLNHTSA